ncbi:transposase domain-containing protein [uncultured Sulfitobacter sp.]|uniref:transposase domain-containing protein n=1 Tax=uncultured Sulfitobacter sp. TaxID=191468 RepID=UPI00259266DD|nr:transposase domain-containing protein [uncultured Sulfitobacter sp.]
MLVPVRNLLGVGRIPSHRSSATSWFEKRGIKLVKQKGRGGEKNAICISDLPDEERQAYWSRELNDLELDQGIRDDEAHAHFSQATAKARARAERKATIAEILTTLKENGVSSTDRFSVVKKKFGSRGTSRASLTRIEAAINDVDPINFAPALLDSYKPTKKPASLSEDAWRFFLTMIRDAAPEWPLREAYRRVRDAAPAMGWTVPSETTFYRRWYELDEAQRLHARFGGAEATKRLTIPAQRDKTSILPLEWVSLDGRTQDYWVDWGDGKPSRPTMVSLVDAASNVILDWELSPSENANATVRVIKRVCEKYGIFENLYPDNGSSFAGHRVAGGAPHRFRNGIAKGVQPLGICKIMGIKLHFALPKNAKAKIAERIFATISRSLDDGPEFKGAHAGHAPGASPSSDIVPVPVELAKEVLSREIARHNREAGRRSQGARGRSYDAILRDGLIAREELGRPVRRATADQIYLAGLHWKPVTVDRNAQITVQGWTYGGPETRSTLAPYRKGEPRNPTGGVQIIFGRDPDDFGAPGVAYDADGNLICRDIEAVKKGPYGSEDGVRQAAKNRKAAQTAAKAAKAANDYLDDDAYRVAMEAVAASVTQDEAPLPAPKVVGARFGSPLQARVIEEHSEKSLSDEDEWRRKLANMDRREAARRR